MPAKMPAKKAAKKGVARPIKKEKKTQIIVAGIDFGTTFSGIAWTISDRVERIEVVAGWQSINVSCNDKQKAPTTISYEASAAKPLWGYGIPVEEASLKWFKLLLLDEEDLPLHVRNIGHLASTRQLLKTVDKTPVEVVADYLRALWQHALEGIGRTIGQRYLEDSNFQIIATLPAIWPHYAQVRMREAISMAGILDARANGTPTLSFISEPEAATLATMDDMAGRLDVEEGDHFVVCDAGGGTVDIITYTIVKLDPMTVKESVKGDGKLCGAVLLDESFLHTLKHLLPARTWDRLGARGIRQIMQSSWENDIKQEFKNDERAWEISVPFGGTIHDGYHPPKLDIKRSNVLPVFRPTVTRIEELVTSQITQVRQQYGKLPKFVTLVGGFGKSQYLYDCLKKTVGKKMEVLQGAGERPWTAVCRGAVIKGLTDNKLSKSIAVVDSRIARQSYGTLYNVLPFEAKEHAAADRVYCDVHQEFLAVEQTKWFLKIGDELSSDEPIRSEFWQDLETPDDVIEIELVVSDAAVAPKRKDSTVRPLCNIRLSKIPGNFNALPAWTNTEGQTYHRVHYELRMVCTGASLEFGIYHKNRRLESRNVSVEFSCEKS